MKKSPCCIAPTAESSGSLDRPGPLRLSLRPTREPSTRRLGPGSFPSHRGNCDLLSYYSPYYFILVTGKPRNPPILPIGWFDELPNRSRWALPRLRFPSLSTLKSDFIGSRGAHSGGDDSQSLIRANDLTRHLELSRVAGSISPIRTFRRYLSRSSARHLSFRGSISAGRVGSSLAAGCTVGTRWSVLPLGGGRALTYVKPFPPVPGALSLFLMATALRFR